MFYMWQRLNSQKLKFLIKDFLSKYDQICWKLRIRQHLLKKSLMKNFFFCAGLFTKHLLVQRRLEEDVAYVQC